MRLQIDEDGQEWEIYAVKPWSFLMLLPLAWEFASSLAEVYGYHLLAINSLVFLVTTVGFILANADYAYVIRSKRSLFAPAVPSGQVTYKQTPLKIWIRRPQPASRRAKIATHKSEVF